MKNNLALVELIKSYIKTKNWVEKATIPHRFSVWVSSTSDVEVMLPEPALAEHPQATEILNDTIDKVALSEGISSRQLQQNLNECDYDIFKIRSSGDRVEHGKIRFSEGLSALEGFYNLIKTSARKNIKNKGKNVIVEQYLDGVNMLAPEAGSFIYSAEVELFNPEDEGENNNIEHMMSLSRYVNSNFALLLQSASECTKSSNEVTAATLLKHGIDSCFCNNFLKLFSDDSDNLEFEFNWSFKEPVLEKVPSYIKFNRTSRNKISSYKKMLKHSKTKKYVDLPAYIEKYSWPKDANEGKVSLRLIFDKQEYVCSVETDEKLFEQLKAQKVKKEIAVTADIVKTSGAKTSVDILKLHQIKIDDAHVIDMLHITKQSR